MKDSKKTEKPENTIETAGAVSDNKKQEAVEEANQTGERILIVDDQFLIRHLYKRLLTKEGFEILEATDGNDAIHSIQQTKPDLILMDVLMKKMDGLETITRIRRQAKFADIPIIMLTAVPDRRTFQECLKAGANDFVLKDTAKEELIGKIRRHLAARGKVSAME